MQVIIKGKLSKKHGLYCFLAFFQTIESYYPLLYSYIPHRGYAKNSYARLRYSCFVYIQLIYLVLPLYFCIKCIAFNFISSLSFLFLYSSLKFVLYTLFFKGMDMFFFIPLLLLPFFFANFSYIIFSISQFAFVFV